MTQRERELESRLATAVGLLRRGPGFMTGGASWPAWCDEVRAFLASAQPAEPRCRYHADSMLCSECQPAAPVRKETK